MRSDPFATSTSYCQTCSSQRLDSAFFPACCGVPICATCVARNPRLKEYVPCLRCGDVRTRDGAAAVQAGADARRARAAKEDSERFVLGDSDEEGCGDEEDGEGEGEEEEEEGGEGKGDGGDTGGDGNGAAAAAGGDNGEKDDLVEVEVKHTLVRGDTLLSVARKYAADPHHLLALNGLPHAALYANPALLRTRRYVVIARRRVPASQAAQQDKDTALDALQSNNGEDDPGRRAARALKRFQLVSKEADKGVGRAYLALNNDNDGGGGPSHNDTQCDDEDRGEKGGDTLPRACGDSLSEKKGSQSSASAAERALEHFFDDDEWAANAPEPARGLSGRWKVVAPVLPAAMKT
ncbi:uncharacterized protein EHS24_003379 [Apiotrichum porosum]|uniref:LysM domain-containing protein n=1 Tax=Apiotrichum porosum TaxID=105984 RepID=A0A427XF90_9TREE|nr:uncharacterized protein EHS24_003379 [Apiotrichum porosum]RSH77413.1 hypothetical protein EHS24_003379 [Apiotrichum porosum]